MLSNAYFLAKFRFDTAENEPVKNFQNFRKMHFRKMHFRKMPDLPGLGRPRDAALPRGQDLPERRLALRPEGPAPRGLLRRDLHRGGGPEPPERVVPKLGKFGEIGNVGKRCEFLSNDSNFGGLVLRDRGPARHPTLLCCTCVFLT